jgi:predicted membrane channel-forming protein YqfA (hemolysin III family)
VKSFENLKLPSNRKFGFFFTSVFALLGSYFLIESLNSAAYVLLALAMLFLLATLIKADALLPLNKLWMQLGLLLGMIVSPIILGIIFFGLFTPMSLLMKLFRRDELRLKLVADRNSHWKKRNADDAQTNTFKHQF